MKRFILLWSLLLFSHANAGFFTNLFEPTQEEKSTALEHTKEEVISVDDYQHQVIEKEEKVFSQEGYQVDEEEGNFDEEYGDFEDSKTIFLSYKNSQKKVYVKQRFSIDIQAIATIENIADIFSTFINGKEYKILNPHAPWMKISEKKYINRYQVKLLSKTSELPDIKVTTVNKARNKQSETLTALKLQVVVLKEGEYFSGLITKKLTIVSHHSKKYDDKSNIVVIEINATDGNLEDFHLPFSLRDGIDSIKENAQQQSIYYFAVLPNYQKELKFKYFNLNTNKFNIESFPIIISDNSISTQTNLNPHKSKYMLYKILGLVLLTFLLLLAYFKYKKQYLLFFALMIALYTIYTKLLSNTILLPKDALLRILPTENSTIFYQTAQIIEVDLLLKKNGYSKILLPNTQIGWIKDADLSKN